MPFSVARDRETSHLDILHTPVVIHGAKFVTPLHPPRVLKMISSCCDLLIDRIKFDHLDLIDPFVLSKQSVLTDRQQRYAPLARLPRDSLTRE